MTPIAKRPILAESTTAELDLSRNLGRRGLDDVTGVVADDDRAFDHDRPGGLEGDGDSGFRILTHSGI